MKTIRILYISIAGNTRNFVNNLIEFSKKVNEDDENSPLIEATEISDQTDFDHENSNFFAFVPTYLDGGNGIDNGVKEMMTNALGEYIAYDDNQNYCIGVVGSGNKNFNEQYCLSAKRYAESFDCPFVGDFELRGNDSDVSRIYELLKQITLNDKN
ncbi:class Ib ribonucleoside-diphosphate reductase assembly flavoprotein NrdI [Apilactobacillus apisilvae]|uniref:Class Ib ribonucleoside-diphosphate reductase assembly flavoprotein NrdI n=1 Tax=Apilactobacillus apisilvae TaxID=2923364 RepID=A0ABY4PFP2_9LACO|nr:class Ib ribonucleoside-diphosphate reductase assembly flavoprotein NrdI [Apilactobacillus apisilvae]UQS84611.1 class Ib ribonucleoside-diphosphate reductase assembly flavoprotein NrdI [Apilactobacillus apisilvae]